MNTLTLTKEINRTKAELDKKDTTFTRTMYYRATNALRSYYVEGFKDYIKPENIKAILKKVDILPYGDSATAIKGFRDAHQEGYKFSYLEDQVFISMNTKGYETLGTFKQVPLANRKAFAIELKKAGYTFTHNDYSSFTVTAYETPAQQVPLQD